MTFIVFLVVSAGDGSINFAVQEAEQSVGPSLRRI